MPEKFDFENWLCNYTSQNIDLEQIENVRNFSLVWNIFEKVCSVYDTSRDKKKVTIGAIINFVDNIVIKSKFRISDYNDFLVYFIDRYIKDNQTNDNFKGLKFGTSPNETAAKNLTIEVLKKNDNSDKSIIKALLFIVYRLRNNYIHGVKDIVTINTQEINFNYTNQILIKILETNK